MKEADYRVQLQSIFNLCALVRRLKITEVLEAMRRARISGTILAPTKYRKALTQLEWQEKCAQAALRFQETVNKIAADPTYFQTGGKQL